MEFGALDERCPLLGDWIVIDNDDGVDSLSNF
jgi:hypothetical protein